MRTSNAAASAPGAGLAHAQSRALDALPPAWRQRIEDAALPLAPVGELEALAREVPCDYWRGYCAGLLVFRADLAAMTGRTFE